MEYAKPLFKDTRYKVEIDICGKDIVVSIDETLYTVNLFNITLLKKDAVSKACEYLSNANKVEMEVDVLGRLTHSIDAYFFIDDELLQARLISDGYGKMSINNPEYKYHDLMSGRMEEVNAKLSNDQNAHYYDRKHGNDIILLLAVVSLILVLINVAIFFCPKKKRIH